ncbi:MAG: hypothetical protein LBD29_03410 [Treponema sp.]|jgi:tetratricopeptide (TPR) repeat protein|nr:hypothetical protein [Treponema sp.]
MVLLINQSIFSQTTANSEILIPNARQSYYIGRDWEAKNHIEEATRYYDEAIRLCLDEIARNRSNEPSYVILTWTLQRQRRYAEVISWGEQGLGISPHNYPLLEIMGEAYFYLDDYDHSLDCMERYSNIVPQGERLSTAYFFIGEIYRLRKKYFHADIAYTTAVALEPNLPLWWYRLGLVKESLKDYTGAIEAYDHAALLRPAYLEARQGLERVKKVLEVL